jgi:hypothetical protein
MRPMLAEVSKSGHSDDLSSSPAARSDLMAPDRVDAVAKCAWRTKTCRGPMNGQQWMLDEVFG